MKKMYLQRAALTFGIAALAATGANAGAWRNINSQMKNVALIPGWSGALSEVGDGVGGCYNGPFELYQVMDLPAGEYTLTANALYRYSNNDDSKANMANGANHNASLFLGNAQTPVKGLFEETVDVFPNTLGEANTAFSAGKYLNTVKFTHPGGDLKFGIRDLGGRESEWTAFDNFKLVGPNGEVEIPNGDFSASTGLELDAGGNWCTGWDVHNVAGGTKGLKNREQDPDVQKGTFRKCNASPMNMGQLVELQAGKYRFGVQAFLRHGDGNQAGWYLDGKSGNRVDGESAYDRHVGNTEQEANKAFVYVTNGDDEIKPVSEEEATHVWVLDDSKPEGGYYSDELIPGKWYFETAVKCIFDEKLDVYPDNQFMAGEGVDALGFGYANSGHEFYSSKCFINNPDLYRNYVEFTLTEPSKVWVGIKKDTNSPYCYWLPFRDFTLEKWDENAQGSGVADLVVEDENAPVEYYNLQGIRVANPEKGLYIVKQGNKVTKRIIK